MSIFDDNNNDVLASIRFFNALSEEDKIRIVADLSPSTLQQNEQYGSLLPLLSTIQHDISRRDATKIGTKLVELGLDETYAMLFVTNMKKHAPTQEYRLHQIDKIPDADFNEKLPNIIKDALVNDENLEFLSKTYSIDRETVLCIVNFVRGELNRLSRGSTTKEKLERECKSNISGEKVEMLLNQVMINQAHHSATLMFSNIQDIFFEVHDIHQQNTQILKLLQEIVELKREEHEMGYD